MAQSIVQPGTPSLSSESDIQRDAFGKGVATSVVGSDITTRTSKATYDAQGRFQMSATNALGQSERWVTDPRFGVPLSHTGPNGLTTA